MESKEELSSASYEERGSKVDGSVNKWKSNERKHWKETNKQMMKRRKQIKVGIEPEGSVNLWKEDEDKPRKNARWKWHWRRGDEIKDEHEAREIQKL